MLRRPPIVLFYTRASQLLGMSSSPEKNVLSGKIVCTATYKGL